MCATCLCFLCVVYLMPTIYCVIKNKLRIHRARPRQSETDRGRLGGGGALQYEFRLRNSRLYLQRQQEVGRSTVPHGPLLNYSPSCKRKRGRSGGVLQSQVSPSLKLDELYRKLSGAKSNQRRSGTTFGIPCSRLFFYVSQRKFASVFRIICLAENQLEAR